MGGNKTDNNPLYSHTLTLVFIAKRGVIIHYSHTLTRISVEPGGSQLKWSLSRVLPSSDDPRSWENLYVH